MKLTLDENNHIIGVEESENGYAGMIPSDFENHKTDGYYSLSQNNIIKTPILEVGVETAQPSDVVQAINILGLQVAKLMAEKREGNTDA